MLNGEEKNVCLRINEIRCLWSRTWREWNELVVIKCLIHKQPKFISFPPNPTKVPYRFFSTGMACHRAWQSTHCPHKPAQPMARPLTILESVSLSLNKKMDHCYPRLGLPHAASRSLNVHGLLLKLKSGKHHCLILFSWFQAIFLVPSESCLDLTVIIGWMSSLSSYVSCRNRISVYSLSSTRKWDKNKK